MLCDGNEHGGIFTVEGIGVFKAALTFIGIIGLSAAPVCLAQSRDRRLDEAISDITLLKRVVKEQDRRIAELEKLVKGLQGANTPPPVVAEKPKIGKPVQPVGWHVPFAWTQVKAGMSRAQVEDILGPPTSVDSVIDSQTLLYRGEVAGSGAVSGSVKLTDDRVAQVDPPDF
jgi:hypothetical protein